MQSKALQSTHLFTSLSAHQFSSTISFSRDYTPLQQHFIPISNQPEITLSDSQVQPDTFLYFLIALYFKGFFFLFLLFISTGEIGNAGNSNKVWAHSAVSNRGWDGIHYQRLQSMCSTPKMYSTVTQGKRADCRLLQKLLLKKICRLPNFP